MALLITRHSTTDHTNLSPAHSNEPAINSKCSSIQMPSTDVALEDRLQAAASYLTLISRVDQCHIHENSSMHSKPDIWRLSRLNKLPMST
jgi:hypothetical protein